MPSFPAWKERKDDDACQTTPLFRVEAIELIIAHRYRSEEALLEGATMARWRMSRSLAVVEQSALLSSVPSCAWSTSQASVHAAASNALQHGARLE
jgi:hypothetical protein